MRIYTKKDNDGKHIFVFGSNTAGIHGAGAALEAYRHWGARYGTGRGRTGQAYAIPTKNEFMRPICLDRISKNIRVFRKYAAEHPELTFLVTPIGCGLAGYSFSQIACFFRHAPENCVLPEIFNRLLKRK